MRTRFNPPQGDFSNGTFVRLYIRAAFTDSVDREPNETDYAYWNSKMPELTARGVEINHPNYAWHRLIGWQAGGPDAALYGPFANPPNNGPANGIWTTAFVDVDVEQPAQPPSVDPPPADFNPFAEALLMLKQIDSRLQGLADAQAKGLSGTVFGYPVRLKP
jgi:hypothetical protein